MFMKIGLFFWFGAVLLIALSLLAAPFATNDGPVHLAFAHLMANMPNPHPLQDRVYSMDQHPSPNLGAYLLMVPLLHFLPADNVETLIQILCIFGVTAAAAFAIAAIRQENRWLALFMLPLSFNQMLFLGLYNFCLSTGAFFLTMGLYYRLRRAPSVKLAIGLSAALTLTYLCHAGGFIMAITGIGCLLAARIFWSARLERLPLGSILRQEQYILTPFILAAMLLANASAGGADYGVPFLSRVGQFARLKLLHNHAPIDWLASCGIALALIGTATCMAFREFSLPRTEARKDTVAALLATGFAVFLMLAFPDTLGSGWTHFRRFELLPYFWILFFLAPYSFTAKHKTVLILICGAASLILASTALWRQAEIHRQMRPLAAIDAQIGSHCTILPIIWQPGPVTAQDHLDWLSYSPYFQAASRLELSKDRVVLFNYLARLGIYPVHFRPGFEPQENLFRWPPLEHETDITTIDIVHYERISHLDVDYILVWGRPEAKPNTDLAARLASEEIRSQLTYRSDDGRISLYRRPADGTNSLCASLP